MPFIISAHEATVVRKFFMMRIRNPDCSAATIQR
jgi:hypothetical protein